MGFLAFLAKNHHPIHFPYKAPSRPFIIRQATCAFQGDLPSSMGPIRTAIDAESNQRTHAAALKARAEDPAVDEDLVVR